MWCGGEADRELSSQADVNFMQDGGRHRVLIRGEEVLSPSPKCQSKLYAHVKRHNMIISASEARTHFLIIPTPSSTPLFPDSVHTAKVEQRCPSLKITRLRQNPIGDASILILGWSPATLNK